MSFFLLVISQAEKYVTILGDFFLNIDQRHVGRCVILPFCNYIYIYVKSLLSSAVHVLNVHLNCQAEWNQSHHVVRIQAKTNKPHVPLFWKIQHSEHVLKPYYGQVCANFCTTILMAKQTILWWPIIDLINIVCTIWSCSTYDLIRVIWVSKF